MLEPDELEERLRGLLVDVDAGSRETIGTFARRFIVCESLLLELADVPPYGWSAWQGLIPSGLQRFDRKRAKELAAERARVVKERDEAGNGVREVLRSYRDLLYAIQSDHGDDGELESSSPARHKRLGWFRRAPETALQALEECPILGIECVEAARSMLIEARRDLIFELRIVEQLLPESHALRKGGVTEALDPELFTKDLALRETPRRILEALGEPADGWKNVAARTGLSLDEVKRWSGRLQRQKLVTKNDGGAWVRTEAGTRLLERKEDGGPTSKPTVGPRK